MTRLLSYIPFFLVMGVCTSTNTSSLKTELTGSLPHSGLPFIINGRDAVRGRWPWQVALTINRQLVCSGVLLSTRFVLTAAQCTQRPASDYEVLIGRHDFRDSSQGYKRSVRRIHNHPSYNSVTKRDDISIVELSSPVAFSTFVQPAYLPDTDASFAGYTCSITGWGSKSGISQTSPAILQEADVPVISNSECSSRMSHVQGAYIYSSSVCVYGRSVTSCKGDGGGPLQCRRCSQEPYMVVGVSSWGTGNTMNHCLTTNPSVYTRTRPFVYWIQGIVGGDVKFPDRGDTGWCPGGGGSTNKPTPSDGMRNEALNFRHLCLVFVTVVMLFSV